MEIVDCHTHSCFSDGHPTIEQNISRACELGLTTIACTDHLTMPFVLDPTNEVSVPESDLPAYADAIMRARLEHPDIDIVFGFECDYYHGCQENIKKWSQGATFLLGSVHGFDGDWIDDLRDLSYWDSHTVDEVWERYFDYWAQACCCGVGFDTMAHPDLVMLLGRFPSEPVLDRLYREAATVAHDAGVRIEVSTAGLRKPVASPYPARRLLELFCEAGVGITVASDAHKLEDIARDIELAYRYAFDSGYRHVDVPTSAGGWRTVDL